MAILCGTTSHGHLDPLERHVMSVSPCKSCRERSTEGWTWGRCTVGSAQDAALIALAPELLEYVASSALNGCATARALVARLPQ